MHIVYASGCCMLTCSESTQQECPNFYINQRCNEISQCQIGCCLDKNNFCYENYLQSQCERNNGIFHLQTCQNINMCNTKINQMYIEKIGNPFLEEYSSVSQETNTIGIQLNPFIKSENIWAIYSINNEVKRLNLQQNEFHENVYIKTFKIPQMNNDIIHFFFGFDNTLTDVSVSLRIDNRCKKLNNNLIPYNNIIIQQHEISYLFAEYLMLAFPENNYYMSVNYELCNAHTPYIFNFHDDICKQSEKNISLPNNFIIKSSLLSNSWDTIKDNLCEHIDNIHEIPEKLKISINNPTNQSQQLNDVNIQLNFTKPISSEIEYIIYTFNETSEPLILKQNKTRHTFIEFNRSFLIGNHSIIAEIILDTPYVYMQNTSEIISFSIQ
ncbi:MAG: hypothetical protein ACMXYC_00405 [Candidatus Woesearchaeota archaeon]